jgi:hypothetical protein
MDEYVSITYLQTILNMPLIMPKDLDGNPVEDIWFGGVSVLRARLRRWRGGGGKLRSCSGLFKLIEQC